MLGNAISRLGAMHAPGGGFSLWGNVSEYEYWLSAYVGNFLLDAKEQGFAVPEQMQRKTADFLLRGLQEGVSRLPTGTPPANPAAFWDNLRRQDSGRFGALAYGAYVMARESKAPLASLRQLHEARAIAHSGLALVQLGIALRLMGDEQRGNVAIAEGIAKPRLVAHWWGDYGTPLRDLALSYALLERHDIKAEGRFNMVALIANELENKKYLSTQEQLAVFMAGRTFTTDAGGAWTARVTSGAKTDTLSATGTLYRPLSASELAAGVTITSTHKERLFVELAYSGFPVKPLAPKSDVIALTRTLYTADGALLGDRPLRAGETLIAHVTAQSRVPIANALVVDRIPAGLEIENLNIVQGEGMTGVKIPKVDLDQVLRDTRVKHREFRDDRFVAAMKLDHAPVHLLYRLRVVTPGKFVVPALYAEDMYRPDLYGTAGGGEIMTIVDVKAR
jgi:uncharacterized protein YfaS (alpha-2-macroglobulin family)